MLLNRTKQQNILEGNLFVNILLFAIPLILTNLLQMLYSAADMMIVGLSNVEGAVGAIGAAGSTVNMCVNLFIGFGIGATVGVANSVGAKDAAKTERVVHTSLLMAVLFGLLGCTAGQIVAEPLLRYLGAQENILYLSVLYCRWYFAGMPFLALANFAASIFRAKGDAKTPLWTLTASGFLNVLLNLLFVLGFKMSVAGVALATLLSSVFTAVVLLWLLHRDDGPCHVSFRRFRLCKTEMGQILRIGVPAGVQGVVIDFSHMLVQSALFALNNAAGGSFILDGTGAGTNLNQFFAALYSAVGAACVTFVGQHIGAGKCRRVRKVLLNCSLLSTIMCTVLAVVMLGFNDFLAGLYVSDPRAVEVVWQRSIIMMPFYFLLAICGVHTAALQAMGKSTMATAISLLGMCAYRVVWMLLIYPHIGTLQGVYWSFPTSWVLTVAVAIPVTFTVLNKKIRETERLGG